MAPEKVDKKSNRKAAEPPRLKNSLVLSRRVGACFRGGAAAVSCAEDRVACACGEEVKILDLDTGISQVTLPGDSEAVTAIAWHPSGQQICVSSASLLTRVWGLDAETSAESEGSLGDGVVSKEGANLQPLYSFRAHDMVVSSMDYDRSGQLLATCDSAGGVRVWDAVRRYCTHNFPGHSGAVQNVTFHPDPERLLLVSGVSPSLLCARCGNWRSMSHKRGQGYW
eukprot:COSAG05_NODE_87_length_20404_cov_42.272051_4_plen_225_part_00